METTATILHADLDDEGQRVTELLSRRERARRSQRSARVASGAGSDSIVSLSQRRTIPLKADMHKQLWPPGEYDSDWACILDHLVCGSELPSVSVYSKCDNRVALLVGRIEKASCPVETNEAWDAALRGLPSD